MSRVKSAIACLVVLMSLPMVALAQKTSKIPTISSLSPSTKTAGAGSFVLTVVGSNFTSGSTVRWNGAGLTTTFISSTQLQGVVDGTLIASAGTASITAYTSGRAGGTSNTLSFTIAAPATITTTITTTTTTTSTSTTPLSIATASVPAGTAGAAYNTSLGASGGTPSYSWSLPSGGGALPPGLILATTGTLTGTPTTAGTYSFTVQAADSSSSKQIAQKVFSMSVAAPPTTTTTTTTTTSSTGTVVFQTGFEDATIPSGFSNVWNTTDVTLNKDPQFVHSGSYSAQFRYYICGATDGTCGGSAQDVNRWFVKYFNSSNGFPNGVDHMFIRGYVYFKSPEPDGSKDKVQRKLYYIMEKEPPASWSFMLTSYGNLGGLDVAFSTNNNAYVPAFTLWNIARLNFDVWYCIELEVKLDTPGSSDGQITLWVNGNQAYQKTGVALRGNYTTGIGAVRVGEQANRGSYVPVSEYRYWDDIIMSTGYVGP